MKFLPFRIKGAYIQLQTPTADGRVRMIMHQIAESMLAAYSSACMHVVIAHTRVKSKETRVDNKQRHSVSVWHCATMYSLT
jgi:hypothetical protein